MRNAIVFAIPVFFLLIAIEWLLIRRKGLDYYRLNDTINDLSCGISQTITRALAKTIVIGGYVALYQYARIATIPTTSLLAWIALFVAVDFCYYWFHRWSHRANAPWGAHIVHHQSEEFNLAVALRQGAFQPFFSSLFYLPLAIIGFPPMMFLAMASLNTVYQFWIHTRLIDRMGWLEWILNTPSHHRVHHGKNPKYLDKNYAGVLIIWDRWFGTFQEEEEEPVYGVTEPLNSWNPIWANFHTWSLVGRKARQAKRWQDRLAIWWRPPEWVPEGLPPAPPHPEVSAADYVKYDPPLSGQHKAYLVLHFVPVFVATLALLQWQSQLPSWQLAALVGFVFGSLLVLGGLFDRSPWAVPAERLRLALLGLTGPGWWAACTLIDGLAPATASMPWQPATLAVASGILALSSAFWLWHIQTLSTTDNLDAKKSGDTP